MVKAVPSTTKPTLSNFRIKSTQKRRKTSYHLAAGIMYTSYKVMLGYAAGEWGLDSSAQTSFVTNVNKAKNMAKGEHFSEGNNADLDQYTKDALDEIFSKEQQSYDDFLERFMFLKKGRFNFCRRSFDSSETSNLKRRIYLYLFDVVKLDLLL